MFDSTLRRSLLALVAGILGFPVLLLIGLIVVSIGAGFAFGFEEDFQPGVGIVLLPFFGLSFLSAFIAASWITARLAPRKPMIHALFLGCAMTVLLAVANVPENGDESWTSLWFAAVPIPLAWIGAKLRRGPSAR